MENTMCEMSSLGDPWPLRYLTFQTNKNKKGNIEGGMQCKSNDYTFLSCQFIASK